MTATVNTSTVRTTATMRFAFDASVLTLIPNIVIQALSDAPGSPEHVASARAARACNRQHGVDLFIPSAGSEHDIDRWEALGIHWRVIDAPVHYTSDCAEVHVEAMLTQGQAQWLTDHLDLCDSDADGGTGGTIWTIPGPAWADGRGWTPYVSVQIDMY